MKRHFLILSLLACAGCMHGPRLKHFETAYQPAGVTSSVTIYERSEKLEGELLSVDDDGLVIAADSQIVQVPYESIRLARFEDAPSLGIASRRKPGPGKKRQLALLSRFPQGLSGDVLRRLIASYGQEQIESVP